MLFDEKMRVEILSRLEGYRLDHTIGCEVAARHLARIYGADEEKCAFAALLHDITKAFSREEQLNLCKKYDIIPCDVEKKEWKMLHGKTASKIAQTEYNAPLDVVEAIACHTAGRKDMTRIDKILYMADYIEPTRNFEGVDKARELVAKDLDEALIYCFNTSLLDLIERGKLIHPDTIEARNDLLSRK